jgi:hypothetical protein
MADWSLFLRPVRSGDRPRITQGRHEPRRKQDRQTRLGRRRRSIHGGLQASGDVAMHVQRRLCDSWVRAITFGKAYPA